MQIHSILEQSWPLRSQQTNAERKICNGGKNNYCKPSLSYCTDNAAMIAATARVMLQNEPSISHQQRLEVLEFIHILFNLFKAS